MRCWCVVTFDCIIIIRSSSSNSSCRSSRRERTDGGQTPRLEGVTILEGRGKEEHITELEEKVGHYCG